MRGFRDHVTSVLLRIAGHRDNTPPQIMSQWGVTSESARRQAAENMRTDPELRERIEKMLAAQRGGNHAEGIVEARKRYPEAYQ